jgi:hypothetical protein
MVPALPLFTLLRNCLKAISPATIRDKTTRRSYDQLLTGHQTNGTGCIRSSNTNCAFNTSPDLAYFKRSVYYAASGCP